MRQKNQINVTKTYLPPLDEYVQYLKQIWKTSWVTNSGVLTERLEEKLRKKLAVNHLVYLSNGTLALQIAIRALDIEGEIITTPFTYIATASSIIWEKCKPVFVDIDPHTLCINEKLIEEKITKKTQAILAVHVYGYPCNVEKIDKISRNNNLSVIYDAAHAFGVVYKGKSLASYGDISTLSFHATKSFHTVEGGAIVTKSGKIAKKVKYMRNFGHKGYEEYYGVGINAKNSEFHAAMGLAVLPLFKKITEKRKLLSRAYDSLLKDTTLQRPEVRPETIQNFTYYPVIFESSAKLKKTLKALNDEGIFPRRYFYPSLNTVGYIKEISKSSCPVSEDISERVMCLPLFPEMEVETAIKTSEIITKIN